MASLPQLPLELIQKVYAECPDIQSVVNLSAASRQFRAAYQSSQKLNIFENVLEKEFGPLYEAKQLVTYNGSQPAHHPRNPLMSMALVKELAAVGYVVKKWTATYPLLRWRTAFEHRRVLHPHEAFRFRRTMYRLWLYGKAFHNPTFLESHDDEVWACSKDRRLDFLRQFSDDAITELTELNDVLQAMVSYDLCPSNAMVQMLYKEHFPEQGPLYFGTYETYPRFYSYEADLRYYPDRYPSTKKVPRQDLPLLLVNEAWGSSEAQKTIVDEVMKLTPDQLLHFRENLANRAERLAYLNSMPQVLHGRQASLSNALEALCAERNYMNAHNHGIDGGILDEIGEEPDKRSPLWIEELGDEGTAYEVSSDESDEGDEEEEESEEEDEEEKEDEDLQEIKEVEVDE